MLFDGTPSVINYKNDSKYDMKPCKHKYITIWLQYKLLNFHRYTITMKIYFPLLSIDISRIFSVALGTRWVQAFVSSNILRSLDHHNIVTYGHRSWLHQSSHTWPHHFFIFLCGGRTIYKEKWKSGLAIWDCHESTVVFQSIPAYSHPNKYDS